MLAVRFLNEEQQIELLTYNLNEMKKILHINATPNFLSNPKNVEMIEKMCELAYNDKSTKNNKMKASELRLGNWVFDMDGQVTLVIEITSELNGEMDVVSGINGNRWSEYHPIVLTDKILLEFGFKKHKTGIGGADMWQGMDGWSLGDSGWLFRGNPKSGLKLVGYFNTNINYVHQLQNLYFALTGHELQYTQEDGV